MEAAFTYLTGKLAEREEEIKRLIDLNKKLEEELQHLKQEGRMENRITDLERRLTTAELKIKKSDEEVTASRELHNALLTDDEYPEVRKEIIKCLMMDSPTGDIGVKKIGEIDYVAFRLAVMRHYGEKMTEEKALQISLAWKKILARPKWQPFKTIKVPGTDADQRVVHTEDELLTMLRLHLGEDAFEIVVTALKEQNDVANGRIPEPELWNYKENRKATLMEGVSVLPYQVKGLKRKRTAN